MQRVLSLAVAVILVAAASPAAPVLCMAREHLRWEMPGLVCPPGVSPLMTRPLPTLDSHAGTCGMCHDVPLLSAATGDAAQSTSFAALAKAACPAAARPACTARLAAPAHATAQPAATGSPQPLRC